MPMIKCNQGKWLLGALTADGLWQHFASPGGRGKENGVFPQHGAELVVGRDAELEVLAHFLDSLPNGAAAVVIEGDQGVGKSHLLNAAVAAGRSREYRILHCEPAESEAQFPFTSLGDLLKDVGDDAFVLLPEPQRRALEVALLRTELERLVVDDRAVLLGTVAALQVLAHSSPVVIAIDDLQWIDDRSRLVLSYVFRRLESEPVGVLVVGSPESPKDSSLGLERMSLRGRVRPLKVGPLDIDSIAKLLRFRLNSSLPKAAIGQIHRNSGGNPFVALELGRAIPSVGGHPRAGQALPVPQSVRELVRPKQAYLSSGATEVLVTVWALAHPTKSLVQAAIGRRGRRSELLVNAIEAGLIEVDGDRVLVNHPLLAAVSYAEMRVQDRHQLHERLADIVADPEERARHLALSGHGPDHAVALELDRAAALAYSRGASDRAADFCELAAEFTPPRRPLEARRRRLHAADYHLEAGNTARARSLLEQAVENMEAGPARADVLRRLGEVHWYGGGSRADEFLAQAALEAGDDASGGALIERDLAWTHLRRGDVTTGLVHAQVAMALTDGLRDGLRGEILATFVLAEAFQGRNGHLQALELAAESEEWTKEPGIHSHPGLLLGVLLKWTDRFDAARYRLEAMREQATKRGDVTCLPFLLHQLSELETWAGNTEVARRHALALSEVAAQTGQEPFRPASLHALALVDACRGKVEEARSAATEGARLAERSGELVFMMQNRSVLGFLELSVGNSVDADRHLRLVTEMAAERGVVEPGSLRFHADAIEALIGVEEFDRAKELLERLEERARTLGGTWALATAGRCRGLLNATLGDVDGAVAALDSALKIHEQLPQPLERGRTLLAMGNVQRRNRQKQAARNALESALRIFEGLGAVQWAERARAEFERNGSTSNGSNGSNGLTKTEHRVTELAIDGLTNQEIANALYMGRKTVETHLSNVYRKLGVRSRLELARKLLFGGHPQGEA
jgi:DNA-binding CsgD family transcriptional regulator